MPVDTRDNDGLDEPVVIVRDAIGTHVDVSLTLVRGILSVVLEVEGQSIGPSAEIDIDDMREALALLERR